MPTVHTHSSALKRATILVFALLSLQTLIESRTCSVHAAPSLMSSDQLGDKMRQAGSFYHESKWNEAIPLYSAVLLAHPDNVKAHENRGICYTRTRKWEKAVDDFNAAIKLDPKSERSYQHRGYVYSRLGKYENAIADCTKTIEINKHNRFAYRDRSRAYAKIGKLDLAQKDFAVQQSLYKVARDYTAALELERSGKLSAALNVFQAN